MWCALMLRIGVRNMTKVDFTMADLQPMSLGYEEGQDVTPEVLKRAEKAYQYFHNKYLELVASGVDKELRDLLIFHDASLEDFVGRVRHVVKSGYYYDSMGVFSVYLEYNDTYAELRDYLNSRSQLMSSVFKKYRMTRKNVLLLAQAIINVNGKIAWQDYASDSPYPDQHSLTMNEIKGSSEKFERFRNEFAHQMYNTVINDEMQRLEHDI